MEQRHTLISLAALLSAAPMAQSWSSPLLAQNSLVLQIGDAVPGLGTVDRINQVDVNDRGQWLAQVSTPGFTATGLVRSGEVVVQSGDAVIGGNGATVGPLGYSGINFWGDTCAVCNLRSVPGSEDQAVLINQTLALRKGSPVRSQDVPAGSTYGRIWCARLNDTGRLAVVTNYFDPTDPTGQRRGIFLHDIDQGIVQDSVASWKTGDLLPGQVTRLSNIGNDHNQFALNDLGQVIFVGYLGTAGSAVFVDGVEVAKGGTPSPSPGRNWTGYRWRVDINNQGSYSVQGQVEDPYLFRIVLTVDGQIEKEVGTGFPEIAPYVVQNMGSGSSQVTELGSTVWLGRWTDPDFSTNAGIFVDEELVLQNNVTTVDGRVVRSVYGDFYSYSGSDNGRWVVARVSNDLIEDMLVLVDRRTGTSYCSPAAANSTGQPSEIFAVGSASVGTSNLTLVATQLPENAFGFFVTSQVQAFVANPQGSQGSLCLGGAIGRYVGPGQVQNSGVKRQISLGLDLAQIPQPNGFVSGAAGETWNFQLWHRDTDMGLATSNFSDGLEIMLSQ